MITRAPQMNICAHHWANKNNSIVLQPTNMTFYPKPLCHVVAAKLAPNQIGSLRRLWLGQDPSLARKRRSPSGMTPGTISVSYIRRWRCHHRWFSDGPHFVERL